MSTYALIISNDPETAVKRSGDQLRGFKRADWLYDGIAYQEGVTSDQLLEAVLKHEEFLPTMVIDGAALVTKEQFGTSWIDNLKKFIRLSNPADISFWVLD